MSQVFSKTPKGLREATGKTKGLDPELLEVLKSCKDNQTAEEIAAVWPEAARETIVWAVGELTKDGYLREVFVSRSGKAAAPAPGAADEGMDLDFSSITSAPTPPVKPPPADPRIEAEQQARREAEAKIRREAEEKVRREAEEKIRREAEEKVRREAEEKVRREAEEKIRRETGEKVRREAEEKIRRETEEKVRREVEEKARIEAAERARREAEEKTRREAEEKVRREVGEKARREAEEKARREAEEKARIEAEERARREAEEKIRREAEEKVRREVDEKARREAEEKARIEAEERARREAEEKIRREAEEKVRREVEEKARIEAAERARREAEEKIRREAEEKVRREVDEKARREAEEKARIEAEEKARIEAEERARREAEEKVRREAEEKVRREAEEQAKRAAVEKIRREALEKFRREEEEKARREAEEKARREAEEKARIEAEEQARIEAEERARREAEETVRREAEEKARREAEEKARIEAEEKARIEAEERARREAEEKVRREAEEKARRKAEEKAQRETDERARLEQEERDREGIRQRLLDRQEGRKRHSRVAAMVLAIIVLPFLALYLIKFLPFDGKRQAFEVMASSALGVGVKAGSAHVELVPKARLTLEDVVLGDAGDGVRVKRVVLGAPLSVLWQMPSEFDSLHLDDARLPVPVLMNLLGTGTGKLPLKAGTFTASRLILAVEPAFLPPLEVEAKVAEGRMTEFAAQADGADSGKVKASGVRGPGAWSVSLNAERFDLPFAAKLKLVDFSATGQLSPERLTISGFKGWLHNGELGGSATLTWQGNWKFGGKFSATRVNASAAAPGWFKDGVFDAQGDIVGIAAKNQDVLPMAQIQAQVGMSRGVLAGVDFDRVLQGRGQGEQFTFDSLKANLLYDAGRIEASQVRLTAGALAATGAVAIGPDQTARGRISIEVKSASSRQTASLSIGGTATNPQYQR